MPAGAARNGMSLCAPTGGFGLVSRLVVSNAHAQDKWLLRVRVLDFNHAIMTRFLSMVEEEKAQASRRNRWRQLKGRLLAWGVEKQTLLARGGWAVGDYRLAFAFPLIQTMLKVFSSD